MTPVRDRDRQQITTDPQAVAQVASRMKTGKTFGEAFRAAMQTPADVAPAPADAAGDAQFEAMLYRWAVATLRYHEGPIHVNGIPLDELLDWVHKYAEPDDFLEWCDRRFPVAE